MSRELVCVAPDGSLEVWHPMGSGYWAQYTSYSFNNGDVVSDHVIPKVLEYGPQFWGREVLGEL